MMGRSYILEMDTWAAVACVVCAEEGRHRYHDMALDGPLCGKCVLPAVTAEVELARAHYEHPSGALIRRNP